MSVYTYSGSAPAAGTFAARRVRAAHNRAAAARAQADRKPTPDNLNRATELEQGAARIEALAKQETTK